MALSVVFFRMHHGKDFEQVSFSGNGIKVLDLKKEILDRKNINRSLDFDLNIVEENGKVYNDDDEFVPKNASVVAKRIPANAKNSLLTRLNNRNLGGNFHSVTHQPKVADIVMPMKVEEVEAVIPPPVVAPVTDTHSSAEDNSAQDADMLALMHEEETVLIRTAPIGNTLWGGSGLSDVSSAVSAADLASGKYRQQRGGMGASHIPPASMGYACNRCGKMGHNLKFCPTNGDPAFDPVIKLMNIPNASKRHVNTLEGVDTTNKTVIENTDGTYQIFNSNVDGLSKLGESQLSVVMDMSEVPEHLKCALSGAYLREAVSLPCCTKSVNDSVIRQELVTSSLRCPLCSSPGVSPEMLIPRPDIREQVEEFIQHRGRSQQNTAGLLPQVYGGNQYPHVMNGYPQQTQHPPLPLTRPPQPVSGAPQGFYPGPHLDPNLALQQQQQLGGAGMYPPQQQQQHSFPGEHQQQPGVQAAAAPGPAPLVAGGPESDIPPLEALPLPMSIHEFLQEQEFQRQERVYLEQLWLAQYANSFPAPHGGYRGGYQGRGGGRGGGRNAWRDREDRDYSSTNKFNNMHYTSKDSVSSRDGAPERGSRSGDNKLDSNFSNSATKSTEERRKASSSGDAENKSSSYSKDGDSRRRRDEVSSREKSPHRSTSRRSRSRSPERKKSSSASVASASDRKSDAVGESRRSGRSSPERDRGSERSASSRHSEAKKDSSGAGKRERDDEKLTSRHTDKQPSSRDTDKGRQDNNRDRPSSSVVDPVDGKRRRTSEDSAPVASSTSSSNNKKERDRREGGESSSQRDKDREREREKETRDRDRKKDKDSAAPSDTSSRGADSASDGKRRREGEGTSKSGRDESKQRDERDDKKSGGSRDAPTVPPMQPLKSNRTTSSPAVTKHKGGGGGGGSRVVYSDEQRLQQSGGGHGGGGGKKDRR